MITFCQKGVVDREDQQNSRIERQEVSAEKSAAAKPLQKSWEIRNKNAIPLAAFLSSPCLSSFSRSSQYYSSKNPFFFTSDCFCTLQNNLLTMMFVRSGQEGGIYNVHREST